MRYWVICFPRSLSIPTLGKSTEYILSRTSKPTWQSYMLDKPRIIELLESIHEHKMARDIIVPVLRQMGLQGVKFTGGADEQGIDVEYYELTEPEREKSYVGIQFKKGNLVYSSGGSKGSVKEVRNQAEEAFEKEVHDLDSHSTRFISRFIVAVTGDINENARKFIGRARQKGTDRRIDYWTGDRLAEYIQHYWMDEFIEYFGVEEDRLYEEDRIVDTEYIRENYGILVARCNRLPPTVDPIQWKILSTVFRLNLGPTAEPKIADLLLELGRTEDFLRQDIEQLIYLEYIDIQGQYIQLSGNASVLEELYESICHELVDAEETEVDPLDILEEIVDIDPLTC